MALNTGTSTVSGQQGQQTAIPSYIARLTFDGDNAYVAGGTLLFSDHVHVVTGIRSELQSAEGFGYTAGVLTHIATYLPGTDALQVYVLATGAEAADGDLSAVAFVVTVVSS